MSRDSNAVTGEAVVKNGALSPSLSAKGRDWHWTCVPNQPPGEGCVLRSQLTERVSRVAVRGLSVPVCDQVPGVSPRSVLGFLSALRPRCPPQPEGEASLLPGPGLRPGDQPSSQEECWRERGAAWPGAGRTVEHTAALGTSRVCLQGHFQPRIPFFKEISQKQTSEQGEGCPGSGAGAAPGVAGGPQAGRSPRGRGPRSEHLCGAQAGAAPALP